MIFQQTETTRDVGCARHKRSKTELSANLNLVSQEGIPLVVLVHGLSPKQGKARSDTRFSRKLVRDYNTQRWPDRSNRHSLTQCGLSQLFNRPVVCRHSTACSVVATTRSFGIRRCVAYEENDEMDESYGSEGFYDAVGVDEWVVFYGCQPGTT